VTLYNWIGRKNQYVDMQRVCLSVILLTESEQNCVSYMLIESCNAKLFQIM